MAYPPNIAGVILAGGLSRRMGGGDKCLRPLGGRPILAHIIERVGPQVETLAINANGDPGRFSAFGLPVVADVVEGYAGPLAGILTGMEWVTRHAPHCSWVASFASDAPFVPRDLVARMFEAIVGEGADLACAASGGQVHPVFGVWRVDLAPDLRRALIEEKIHKVDRWTSRYRLAVVEFAAEPFDPFFNANRPEDLAEAARLLEAGVDAQAASRR
ncbi:MAG TPA: molybdenum cofactor guanylyltransferase MobA [Alphaproteobacteria bacterium]